MFKDAFDLLYKLAFKSWNLQGLEYKIIYWIILIVMISIISILVKGYVESEVFPRLTGTGKPTSKEGQIYRHWKNKQFAKKFKVEE